jgi:RNA ligase
MESIDELGKLVKSGFSDWETLGDVRALYHDDLVLFNYTRAAQFSRRWNWFEQVSRGLIFNTVIGEIAARPFDRFWNWLEDGRTSSGRIVTVTEKLDGSLGILYRSEGQYKIATRGSFDGEQAMWATNYLQRNHKLTSLPISYTLLFEIIYPENRIVVDYGDAETLYLLAARNRFTGEYLPFYPNVYRLAQNYGFPLPKVYDFNSMADILAAADSLPATEEGWVIEFSDGQRFKVKGDQYVEVHRLVTNATFKRVLEAVASDTFDEMITAVPDEFLGQIHAWRNEIEQKVIVVTAKARAAFERAPKATRKEFALWIQANHKPLSAYLFNLLDGKGVRSLILKREF